MSTHTNPSREAAEGELPDADAPERMNSEQVRTMLRLGGLAPSKAAELLLLLIPSSGRRFSERQSSASDQEEYRLLEPVSLPIIRYISEAS